jgi:hypothetical protein
MGMEGGPARAPVGPMSPEQREQLEKVLSEMNVIEAV